MPGKLTTLRSCSCFILTSFKKSPENITCPALVDDNNADWSEGTEGVNSGTCNAGYYVSTSPYTPQRSCSATTGWGAVTLACERTSSWFARGAGFITMRAHGESIAFPLAMWAKLRNHVRVGHLQLRVFPDQLCWHFQRARHLHQWIRW